MNKRNTLMAVRQSGASKAERRGRSTKRFTVMRIVSATSKIIALMSMYFAALDDADCSGKSPTPY
jgi:hypothetical protein